MCPFERKERAGWGRLGEAGVVCPGQRRQAQRQVQRGSRYRAMAKGCCGGFAMTEVGCDPRGQSALIPECVTETPMTDLLSHVREEPLLTP